MTKLETKNEKIQETKNYETKSKKRKQKNFRN